MIIVDYIQLMKGTLNYKDGRVQEVSEITQGLKAIAKELSIPVVALSQLSRQVEQRDNKKPQLSDLRESGQILSNQIIVVFYYLSVLLVLIIVKEQLQVLIILLQSLLNLG